MRRYNAIKYDETFKGIVVQFLFLCVYGSIVMEFIKNIKKIKKNRFILRASSKAFPSQKRKVCANKAQRSVLT